MLLELEPVAGWPELLAVMSRWYLSRDKGWRPWPRGQCYPREYSWASQQLGDVHSMRLLDAGGSGSAFSAALAERGAAEVVVADRGDQGIRPFPARGVSFRLCDLQSTGLVEGSFDHVVSVSAVEHNQWSAQLDVLQHLMKLVRRGGRLVVTVPAVPTAQRAWHENYKGWGAVYFWTHAAAAEASAALADLGELEVPLLGDRDYDSEWARIDAAVREAWSRDARPPWPPVFKYPYQSMGLTWRRR